MGTYFKNHTLEQTQAILDQMAFHNLKHTPQQKYTVADRFEERAQELGDKAFIIYQDKHYSYAEINAQANQVANFAKARGLRCGDVACVMMENRPEFFTVWLGLAKLGVTVALINTQIKERALSHAIETAGAKAMLIGGECMHLFNGIDYRPENVQYWYLTDAETTNIETDLIAVDAEIAAQPRENLDGAVEREGLVGESPIFYIYTSGTTGLPKAAKITHMRWVGVGDGMVAIMNIVPEDVFYCVLPLFHGAAGMSLTSTVISCGGTLVVRRKFSASNFWPEVRRHKITVCQYIGEICRYLMNAPESPDDKNHTLRKLMGAGLGADIWEKFQARFNIADIYEGWSSTEANTSLINLENKVGSCGRQPFPERHNARLLKWDFENEDYVRDENGFIVECKVGEVGEMVGMILHMPETGACRFDGYTDEQATEKKRLRNVFQEGDCWWSSGDLLRFDEDRYFYFVDRVGDTFRWKSENVSTMEVAEAINEFPGIEIANVYGVKVPGQEGRAGMVTLVMQPGFELDLQAFYQHCQAKLPKYAVPVFVRLSAQAEMTSTFKLRKVDLQKQGYSPALCGEPVYVAVDAQANYLPVTAETLAAVGLAAFEQ